MLTSQQEIRWKKLTLWLTCKQKYYILALQVNIREVGKMQDINNLRKSILEKVSVLNENKLKIAILKLDTLYEAQEIEEREIK
ncbi:hypothetical protein KLO82_17725 [Clostridioides difficile]|uniref:hypothetical protein n=1 Tax=Clostridioides difficile TaxID=1496 RepID=UPI00129E0ACF|nr:hypothetical protein [Clostridioides difficile]EIS9571299.1 hypothetical protein [Clostridioides difficile]MBY1949812.1 hypothetical protein [Clostridioides difficile]MBZ0701389.1 hypothetical protein [Clostridioides difficile]MCA0583973.1 hypothetical protein [Clostridioides difficile]MCO8846853.1 hypothetical protein [Clostridioides difficile]